MKIMELNEMELMVTNGGGIRDRSRSHESRSRASSHGSRGSGNHGCSRDWGGVAAGAGKALAGGIGYAGTLFGDDGSESRINHIKEATGGLAKSGWNQMRDGFKCKKR